MAGLTQHTSLIITARRPLFRVVRSIRTITYDGQPVTIGAIRDRGWLVLVRQSGRAWTTVRAIRKRRTRQEDSI